jgi:hypothetical protein
MGSGLYLLQQRMYKTKERKKVKWLSKQGGTQKEWLLVLTIQSYDDMQIFLPHCLSLEERKYADDWGTAYTSETYQHFCSRC